MYGFLGPYIDSNADSYVSMSLYARMGDVLVETDAVDAVDADDAEFLLECEGIFEVRLLILFEPRLLSEVLLRRILPASCSYVDAF